MTGTGSAPLTSTRTSRARALLRAGPFYLRLLPAFVAAALARLIGQVKGGRSVRFEQRALSLCNRLFRAPFDPDQFLDVDAFATGQDTSDWFTLCRRTGIGEDWFRGHRVLDVGCGPGTFTFAVAGLGVAEVQGIDIAANRIRYAADRARRERLDQVTFREASVYDLPYPPASFDRVMSHTVFEHLPDVPGALEAIHRVLRPGGELVFTHDAYYARYGAHVAHFVHLPWPCGFFLPDAVAAFWEDRRSAFLQAHGLSEPPELLDLADGLWSLNRMTMQALQQAIDASPFEVVAVRPYARETALLDVWPALEHTRLGPYLTGSRVIRLRKPEPRS